MTNAALSYEALTPVPVSAALLASSPELVTDADLLHLAAEGERDALSVLYDRQSPMLLALALRILRNRQDAEEVVQEVFLYVWRKAAGYDPSRAAVSSWLVLITRSRSLDRLRSHQRMGQMKSEIERAVRPPARSESYTAVLSQERASRLRQAMERLPDAQREVLEFSFYRGLTQREVAERTGIPIGTVKTRTLLAMQKLRKELGGERHLLM